MQLPVSDDDVLLIIDVQNDFCPGGALAVPEGDVVVPVINRLAERFEHVMLTQDWHPPSHSSFATSHPGSAAFELDQHGLRSANPLARSLRASNARVGVSPATAHRPGRVGDPQGFPSGDRLVFRIF